MGCETYSSSVDVVAIKNYLKKVFDTLTDIDLEDELKLRVATKLSDKSAATWWDKLKLLSNTPVTWDLFVQDFNEQYYTRFQRD